MSEAVITLHGLTKRFAGMDKPAVAPLDFLPFIRLCHRAGRAGRRRKTTLMRMLAGLLKPMAATRQYWASTRYKTTASCTFWAIYRRIQDAI